MKTKTVLLIIIPLFLLSIAQESFAKSQKKYKLKNYPEKLGYSLGNDIGKSFTKNEMDLDKDAFIRGFLDGLSGINPLLTIEEMRSIQKIAIDAMRNKLSSKRQISGEVNKKNGAVYCAENARKRGVRTTPSGLQYKVLKKGNGPIPKETDRVQINYIGTLVDGTEFDNSFLNGKPSVFQVSNVIQGMSEALLMMPVGSKWEIVLPSELAYKEHGAGTKIGPNETLIFEIELLGIENTATEDEINNDDAPNDDSLDLENTEESSSESTLDTNMDDQ